MKRSTIFMLAILLGVRLLEGCDAPDPPRLNNPMDPESPSFVPPETIIQRGPEEGETVNSDMVEFTWTGNTYSSEFCFKLDDGDWSEWSPEHSVILRYLDEGTHQFSVKSRYSQEYEDQTSAQRTFTVDAVQGPALLIAPYKARVADTIFAIEVVAEEVSDLMLAHIELSFDPDILEIIKFEEGNFIKMNGGSVVLFPSSPSDGYVTIDIGVAAADPPGVSGSGAIAVVKFRVLFSDPTWIRFSGEQKMRDSINNEIALRKTRGCFVEIERP